VLLLYLYRGCSVSWSLVKMSNNQTKNYNVSCKAYQITSEQSKQNLKFFRVKHQCQQLTEAFIKQMKNSNSLLISFSYFALTVAEYIVSALVQEKLHVT